MLLRKDFCFFREPGVFPFFISAGALTSWKGISRMKTITYQLESFANLSEHIGDFTVVSSSIGFDGKLYVYSLIVFLNESMECFFSPRHQNCIRLFDKGYNKYDEYLILKKYKSGAYNIAF
jgi:hypothetical protein